MLNYQFSNEVESLFSNFLLISRGCFPKTVLSTVFGSFITVKQKKPNDLLFKEKNLTGFINSSNIQALFCDIL